MDRNDNAETIEILFQRLRDDFGPLSDNIIRAMVETIGGMRLTFLNMKDLDRINRNMRIRAGFNGLNYTELAERHGIKTRQIRRILHGN